MKYLKTQKSILLNLLILALFVVITGCMPEQAAIRNTAPSVNSNQSTDNTSTTTTTTEPKLLPEAKNFLQLGTNKYLTTMTTFSDYGDSFIIRGNALNSFLKTYILNNPQNLCLATYYADSSGTNAKKVLVMAARIRSFLNNDIGGKEYFLQVEVANETANISDCLTVGLNNALSQEYSSTSNAYIISKVCPSCSTSILSEGLKIFDASGSKKTAIDLSHLKISLLPALGSSTSTVNSPTCSSNSVCNASGYNCCIQGQCVIHGEVKAGVNQTSNNYLSAVQQILARPELIGNYQEYFYVCPNMIPTNPDNNQLDPGIDPIQQAANLFTELQDLYKCLNPVIDEFSICTKEYTKVSETLASNGGQYNYQAAVDDITFSSINPSLNYNNITGLEYAGIKVYQAKLYPEDLLTSLNSSYGTFLGTNDDLSNGQFVTFKMPLPANAINDTLKVRYRVDGTCVRIGSSIAKCTKYYKQGQTSNPPRSSDHSSGQTFKFPSYANSSYNVIVEVGGVRVSPGTDTWTLTGNSVVFNSSLYPIYNNQEVSITYFVTSNVNTLMSSKETAQVKVDSHCACGTGITCNLKPVYSEVAGVSTLTSYECKYPGPDVPEPPLQKTVFISARSVAHRFYDSNGVSYEYDEIGSSYKQECAVGSGDESNCKYFEYTNNDVTKPNNVSQYIGFTELLGTFNKNEFSPIPATKLDVVKGRYYELFTDEGVFSSCLNCGTDYYTSVQKIFPDNFIYKGGGYLPNLVESRRLYNQGSFNADDMKFGRACFVPPTMIPWTHKMDSNVATQRRGRLKAQHFLFANGYNKDWYGFDYGSLIGSFDGVHWFSVGNQRRIQAKSNKLFLAINAYFGDVTANNTFRITISETAAIVNSGSSVTHDTQSDGAQCQIAHFCEKDTDCITQLGYDYTCQNVSSLSTPWPMFDSNGNEVSGSNVLSLLSLVGGSNGQVKRCVYRGRGAICAQNAHTVVSTTSYTNSNVTALHACSPNNYCETLDQAKFNDRIGRYATTPSAQNNKTYITVKSDTFGLGARILGRPYKYNGDSLPPSGVATQFMANNVNSICIPGKSPSNSNTTADINGVASRGSSSDKILGIGKTIASNDMQDPKYFSACPTTDEDGNYTNFDTFDLDDETNHSRFSITQNMSTNSLNLSSLSNLGLFNDTGSLVTTKGYHKDTCLRAPGAKCFSDFDCSPNSFISGKIKTLTNFLGEMTEAEQNFWKEDLVCANSQPRYVTNSVIPNPYYELYEHRCCRETGKTFTNYSQFHEDTTGIKITNGTDIYVPGVNMDINDPRRYSRIHTTYDKMVEDPDTYPPLYTATPRPTSPLLLDINSARQYNTLHLNNARMCCTGHWVREFATGTYGNNGGHKFKETSQQNIDIDKFKYLNWYPNNVPALLGGTVANTTPYYCTVANSATLDCEVKSIIEGSAEEKKYMTWMGKFELLGIPQVLIETNKSANNALFPQYNMIKPLDDDQVDISSSQQVLPLTIKDNNGTDGITDVIYDNGITSLNMYSAASSDNFEIGSGKMKRVFSENKFACCIPTGVEVDDGVTNEQCCTGQVTNQNGPVRCCLNDGADLSVYTNRYVSSEGAYFNGQKISDNDIDPTTGYIKKEIVMQMASTMCCSGQGAYGVAVSELYTPLIGGNIQEDRRTRRWLYLSDMDNADGIGGVYHFFTDRGQKYNDHVYCVSADDGGSGGSGSGGSGSTTGSGGVGQ